MQNEASTSRPHVTYEVRGTHPAQIAATGGTGVLLHTTMRAQAERCARDCGGTVHPVLTRH